MTRDLSLAAWQVRYGQRTFWRNRRGALVILALPLMFLLVLGSLTSGATIDTRSGLPFIDFYTPGIVAYAITLVCFNMTAMGFAGMRESGVLARIRTTPLPLPVFVLGTIGSTVLVMLAATTLLLVVGVTLFGADLRPEALPGLVATIALGCTALTTLGIGAAKLVPNPENGMGVLMFVTLPVTFVSNVFFPIDGAPQWVQDVAGLFPLRPLADGLQACFDPTAAGAGLVAHDLLVLALWTLAGCAIMVRSMRSLDRNA
jgi:ABC-2 type transport system permease protein